MKTKQRLLGVAALCAFVTVTADAQNGTVPEVLPKPEQAFTDAKIQSLGR
jgi:hypothetical protein